MAGLAAISAMALASSRMDRTFLVRGMRDLRCIKPIGAGCVGHKAPPPVEAGHGKHLFETALAFVGMTFTKSSVALSAEPTQIGSTHNGRSRPFSNHNKSWGDFHAEILFQRFAQPDQGGAV